MSVLLNVSIGEAIDKLTILDIKCDKLTGKKHDESKKEYNMLLSTVNEYINLYGFHYKCLKYVNLKIWELQDIVKNMTIKNEHFSVIWNDITLYNDMRFRIKNKINNLTNSFYKEQKGYAEKAIHLFINIQDENITKIIGGIRYLAICYDKVFLYVKNCNLFAEYFYDDDFINIISDFMVPENQNYIKCDTYSEIYTGSVPISAQNDFFYIPAKKF